MKKAIWFLVCLNVLLWTLFLMCGCTEIKYGDAHYRHISSDKSWEFVMTDPNGATIKLKSTTNTDKASEAIGTLAETVQILAKPK